LFLFLGSQYLNFIVHIPLFLIFGANDHCDRCDEDDCFDEDDFFDENTYFECINIRSLKTI
jgi:hypothetical protein